MAELPTVDISSYPKSSGSPLETFGKFQQLEQQGQQLERGAIAIDHDKLKLINERYGIVSREMQGLLGDPDLNFDKVAKRFQNLVNLGLIPSKMMAQSLQDVPTDKAQIQGYIKMKVLQAQGIMDAVNATYGAPGLQTQGQQLVPTRTGAFVSGGVQRDPSGVPIQIQAPPTTEITDTNQTLPNGQPNPAYGSRGLLGPQREQPTPGASPLPVARPNAAPQAQQQQRPGPLPVGPITNPAVAGPSANFGGNVTGGEIGPNLSPAARVAQGFPVPSGISTGMPPLFEEGKKQLVEAQNVAAGKSSSLQPLIQAIPLIKGLTTGIGTETYNKALAGLSNLGWLPEGATGKVADYQVVNKKLADYLRTSPLAGRSDAAQALSQSASPDPKGQINQALMKLAKDAVALDRMQIAMPHAFEGQDFTKFGQHMSSFANKVDPRAFNLDMLDDKESVKLLTDMDKKLNSKNTADRAEAQKFRRSLAIVEKLKLF